MPGADLSYLFQNQPPAGMMAGWGQGRADAQAESELEKAMIANQQSKFNLDRSKQLLPGELDIQAGQAAQGRQDASQPMLDNRLKESTAKSTKAQYDTWKQLLSMPKDQLDAYFSEQHTRMSGTINQMANMAQQGAGGKELIPFMDKLVENAPPEQQAAWKKMRNNYINYPPQKAYQELMKLQQAMNEQTPEIMKEHVLQQGRMELQRLENQGAMGVASVRAQGDDKPGKYSIEQKITQYTEMLTQMKPDDPRRKTIEDAIRFLVSQKQSMGAYDQTFDLQSGGVSKRPPGSAGSTAATASAPKKWNPQTKKWE